MRIFIFFVLFAINCSLAWTQNNQPIEILQTSWDNPYGYSPGDLLIKSSNEILYSTGCAIASGTLYYLSNEIPMGNAEYKQNQLFLWPAILFGGMSIYYSISSVVSLRRAGILLNENGIGICISL